LTQIFVFATSDRIKQQEFTSSSSSIDEFSEIDDEEKENVVALVNQLRHKAGKSMLDASPDQIYAFIASVSHVVIHRSRVKSLLVSKTVFTKCDNIPSIFGHV